MDNDDHILLRAAAIRLRRAAQRAALAFSRLGHALDDDKAGRDVERFIADARGETPPSDEVLRAGPSEDAKNYRRRQRRER